MKLHLDFKIPPVDFQINHNSRVLLTGSCFSENIGELLRESRFEIIQNPHGILFNPASIACSLLQLIQKSDANESLFLNRGENYYSFQCHSGISASNKKDLSEKLTGINKTVNQFLKDANALVITFGTAYYYKHLALNAIVGNCHKQPPETFNKLLLSVDEIENDYSVLISELQKFNPALKIIFTVSPVKHLRDGIVENNLSKASLLLATHKLTERFNNCYYFPAYELVNDDLRDYRFYKEDMAHPNSQAIQYIWEKFSDCYFNSQTKRINEVIKQLNMATSHKFSGSSAKEELKLKQHIIGLETAIESMLQQANH